MKRTPAIKFGTDGWRALVAEEFTFPNVRGVAQAIAEYLKEHPTPGRSRAVIVGYDTRPFGDRFAEAVAEVLAGNRLPVLLTKTPMPTPAVSLFIRELRLSGGVLITASHNPFTYNGVKFRPFYAGSAEPGMTRWIEKRLFRHKIRCLPLKQGMGSGTIRRIDLRPRYLRFLRRYVRWELLRKARFRVAYDSMYGAGQDLLREATRGSALKILPLDRLGRSVPSRHRPEPIAEHLKELSCLVRGQRCHVGLATDGDADRVGVLGPDGRFITSQETMALLSWHLLEDRGGRGMLVTTVAGTNLMDSLAARYGVALTRTPVGFKHIVKLMRETDVLFGGEESGGFAFRGCVPERDGLLAGLLILEMMSMRRKSLGAILKELRSTFGEWAFERGDLVLSRFMEGDRLLRWARSGAPLPGAYALPKVRDVQTLDGVKLLFEDRSWLLMRPSGTEPLLRIYAEAPRRQSVHRLIRAGQALGRTLIRS